MLNFALHSYLKMNIFHRGNMQKGVEVSLARACGGGCTYNLFFRTLQPFL